MAWRGWPSPASLMGDSHSLAVSHFGKAPLPAPPRCKSPSHPSASCGAALRGAGGAGPGRGSARAQMCLLIICAFEKCQIKNFWIQTGSLVMVIWGFNPHNNSIGKYPLLCRQIPEGVSALNEIVALLCHREVSFILQESVTFSKCTHFLSPQIVAYTDLGMA